MSRQIALIRLALLTTILLAVWVSTASAYETYASGGISPNRNGNCAECHGDFLASPYTSAADGASWGDDLHDVHRLTMLSGDCDACHTGPDRLPVFLGSSDGGTGFSPIGCLGCHGRVEGGDTVTGTGLRQHHWNNGVETCGTGGCHPSDSNPASFTPVGEDVLPPYYVTPDASHSNKPTDPCNPAGEEDFAATVIGLDNDGDNVYDQNDPDCQVVVVAPNINFNPASLNFGEMVPPGSSASLDTAIRNLGNADLDVTAIALCAGTSGEFTWMPAAPFTVAPGASQTLTVTYSPVDEGPDAGCLEITSNDPDEATKQLPLLNKAGTILQFTPAFIRRNQNNGN